MRERTPAEFRAEQAAALARGRRKQGPAVPKPPSGSRSPEPSRGSIVAHNVARRRFKPQPLRDPAFPAHQDGPVHVR